MPESTGTPTPMPTVTTGKPRQACDSCRFRKVRCDRGQPCRRCKSASLRCDYLRAVGKTGPRCGQGRRQVQLRQGLVHRDDSNNSLSLDVFCPVTVAPPALPVTSSSVESPTIAQLQGSRSSASVSGGSHDDEQQQQQQQQQQQNQRDQSWTTTWPPADTQSQDSVLSHHDDNDDTFNLTTDDLDNNPPTTIITTSPYAARDERYYSRGLSEALAAHVRVFLKYLFPIMPIVDQHFVDDALLQLPTLPPSRYAAIAALCAATRVQLRLDNSKNGTGDGPDAEIPVKPLLSVEMLISLAEGALRQYSVIDDEGLDSVLASFFLFATYGNLDNPRHSWFYLDQAISLAHSLGITSEDAGYRDLERTEQEKRRRVFWVLFVTERTFALQHRRGVRLRDNTAVAKPRIVDSDCPVVMHDFVNHIRVFEQLPAALYSWHQQDENSSGSGSGSQHLMTLPPVINRKLCGLSPDKSVIESQRLDTTLTQQWLRIAMWRLTFGQNPLPFFPSRNSNNNGLLLPVDLPMDAAKVLMGALSSVGPSSRDCHGIGLEQKLFDIGVGLADATRISAWDTPSSALQVGPRELLSCIVQSLSSARGCPSHLLPNLLRHSGDLLLQPCSPVPMVSLQWHLDQAAMVMGEQHQQSSHVVVEEELMEEAEACSQDWLGGDLPDFEDIHASSLAGICDDASDLGTSFGGTTGQVALG